MKIVIEAQRIFRPNKHGMDFVTLELLKQLQIIDKENEYYVIVAPGEDKVLSESDNMHIIETGSAFYPLWEQYSLPKVVKKIKPDILHCTSNTAPVSLKVPLILTLHDIIFLEKREYKSKSLYQNFGWYYRKLVVPRILKKCKKVITVSNFERNRIDKKLHLGPDRLVYVYNGYSDHFKPIDNPYSVTSKYLKEEKYLFFLGNTDPKKNTPRVLKAYNNYVKETENPLPLLIADLKEEYIDGILKEENISSVKNMLRYPGYIKNTDLPYIYSGAEIFVYPSLRESFGIPILESMACGTPIITSNAASMPEVAGDGVLLVDPQDEVQITNAIIKLLSDKDFYNNQVEYGFERIKNFSWRNTALQTLEIYKSVYNTLK